MDDARPSEVRRQAMARIEKEATDKNGLRNDVVTLYQGGQYHLYTYKKYTDVRLVFAPEFDIAFFGGDPDNFEYPRYDLDVCFFRAYEDGKPAKVEHSCEWSPDGSKEGELVFVAGHPGRTDRLNTVASLEYLRDVRFPFLLDYLKKKEAFLLAFGRTAPRRPASRKEELFSIQNSRKARVGGLEGLQDAGVHEAEGRRPRPSSAAGSRRPDSRASGATRPGTGSPRPRRRPRGSSSPGRYLERGWAFDSTLFDDRPRPGAPGRREHQAERGAAQGVPRIGPQVARTGALLDGPDLSRVRGGQAGPLARRVEEGDARRSPGRAGAPRPHARRGRARVRHGDRSWPTSRSASKLAEGGMAAIEASDDPMIKLALAVDAEARGGSARSRRTRSKASRPRTTPSSPGPSSRTRATPIYPDATFTLRLAFGVVKGYEVDGKADPAVHRRSAGPSSTPRPTATRRPTSCRRAGSRPASRASSAWRRRSTSSRPPTSSAATRAARSSTARTRSSA